MSRRAVRLQDVAERAGVAFITAWRALNDPKTVSQKTRAKVDHAADELGYVANSVARSLVSSKSGVAAVIVPTLEDSIFADTVQGISDGLAVGGRELMIGLSGYSEARETELVIACIGRQIDGLVLVGRGHSEKTRRILGQSGVPVVETWDYGPGALDMMVGFSNRAMAEAITRRLAEKGRRRVAFVSPLSRPRALERLAGYRSVVAEAGLDPNESLVVDAQPNVAGGVEAFERLMALEARPDAIFCNGDALATGMHIAGSARGLAFPDDVAIIGVHDTEIASQLRPPLSTVRIPRYEIGRRAADALCRRFEDPTYSLSLDLGFEIIERGTT